LGDFPATLDLFKDGSLYVIDAPGHLAGHINLLARTSDGDGTFSWVYLAGDSCHDRRILSKEREIGEWIDAHGHQCCIHADRKKAEETIARIKTIEDEGVEVILAHDVEWERSERNKHRFFGA
jgi:glyoxylase-like metal-dependent hydrolase (beta-lactamase superfamily II)